jgi:hypothetical protein
MSANPVLDLANKISSDQGMDLLLLNAGISRSTERRLVGVLKKRLQKKANAAVIVCTEGGDADAAFRIARHIQDAYAEHTAIVAGWSSGRRVRGYTLLWRSIGRILVEVHYNFSFASEAGLRHDGSVFQQIDKCLQVAG